MAFWDGKKILVVDDEEGIRELVVSELEFNGATCVQASNGKVAFDLYKKENFDAVVSDIRMPEGDGMYFLDKIKENNLKSCVMIFMTGFSDVPIEEIYDRGVEAVVAKPFRLDQLVDTLQMAMVTPRMTWRKTPRMVSMVDIEVQWPGLNEPMKTKTFNLGRGGVFIQTSSHFPSIGTVVKFKMSSPLGESAEVLRGEMVVRWVRSNTSVASPAGFGGEFLGMTAEQMDDMASMAGLAQTRVYIPKK